MSKFRYSKKYSKRYHYRPYNKGWSGSKSGKGIGNMLSNRQYHSVVKNLKLGLLAATALGILIIFLLRACGNKADYPAGLFNTPAPSSPLPKRNQRPKERWI